MPLRMGKPNPSRPRCDRVGSARLHRFSPATGAVRSLSSTTSPPPPPTAGSTWPTARTTASRSSTRRGATRRSGATCTGPAGSSCREDRARIASSASSGPAWPSSAMPRILARGSRSSSTRASLPPGSGVRANRGRSPAGSLPPRTHRGQPGRHLCRRGLLYELAVKLRRPGAAPLSAESPEAREALSPAPGPGTGPGARARHSLQVA